MTDHDEAWYAARRAGITSTDIPAILGVDPWRSEGDVAREKAGEETQPSPEQARRFRLGLALEDAIKAEEEVEHGIALRRVRRILTHHDIPWALTSLDYERVGERTIVEVKTSSGREWDDGLPDRVEAQVRWQMGVAGYPRAHVAALRFGRDLVCHDVDHDPATFDALLSIAADFRARQAAGGPFAETRHSSRRAWPTDDDTEAYADGEVIAAVADLLTTRASIRSLSDREDALVAAIQTRMGPAAVLLGPSWKVTWRRTRDVIDTDWNAIAQGLLGTLPEDEREALVSLHSMTRPGSRRFVVREEREKT